MADSTVGVAIAAPLVAPLLIGVVLLGAATDPEKDLSLGEAAGHQIVV